MNKRTISPDPLIILGAGPQQVKAYQVAKNLGFKVVGVDFNPDAEARYLCDYFVLASVKDADECISKLASMNIRFSGVITCGVEVSPQVSKISDHFGLISIPDKVAHNTTHKGARLTKLNECNVPIPKFERLKEAKLPSLSFPFVIKPSDSSGSRGVRQVKDEHEFMSAFNEAISISSDDEVIVESFESGTEISIEGFVLDEEMIVTGIAERHFYSPKETYPEFLEYGGTMPPSFAEEYIEEAKKVFAEATRALGIKEGPSKGDLILTEEGIKVLEITSRTSPGFAAEMQPLASGAMVLEALILWATGSTIPRKILEPKWNKAVAHRYYKHKAGKVLNVSGLNELAQKPGVEYIMQLNQVKKGDVLDIMNYMNRIFYIITVAETPELAIELAESALSSVIIEVEPVE